MLVLMIVVSKDIVPKHYLAITIWPFIFVKKQAFKKDVILLNHERIHYKQQIELLVIPFFILYLLEFIYGIIKFKSSRQAYRQISFEREAYTNENNLNYLKSRLFWNFKNYY
ncbi:hypothetical protein SAMN04487989_106152 [Bizionia echini]|uniref:BlaR1 peptidase M56 n=2 Tax=Bizionia echini TaxID=649333 RepID=A0A1I5D1E2_9FLAO|nr:hypothetical protein SAMN04487989_106152 [Bizionia echini]